MSKGFPSWEEVLYPWCGNLNGNVYGAYHQREVILQRPDASRKVLSPDNGIMLQEQFSGPELFQGATQTIG